MKTCGTCKAEKPLSEFYARSGSRIGYHSACKKCFADYGKRRNALQPNYLAEWRKANPTAASDWYKKNKAHKVAYNAALYEKNKQSHAVRYAKWAKENADKKIAGIARRRAAKMRAVALWANGFFIEQAYAIAQSRTKLLGRKWSVDHIVPLQSRVVCGLHVETNLQVIPASANIAKGNRVWPDMPC